MDADGNRVEVTIQKKEDVSEAQQAQAEAQPEQTQSAPVQTGDSTPVTWLFALLALSGTGIVGSKAKKKPRRGLSAIKSDSPCGVFLFRGIFVFYGSFCSR